MDAVTYGKMRGTKPSFEISTILLFFIMMLPLLLVSTISGTVPTVEIAPGVNMPSINVGTWSYGNGQPSDPSIGVRQGRWVFRSFFSSSLFFLPFLTIDASSEKGPSMDRGRRHGFGLCMGLFQPSQSMFFAPLAAINACVNTCVNSAQ